MLRNWRAKSTYLPLSQKPMRIRHLFGSDKKQSTFMLLEICWSKMQLNKQSLSGQSAVNFANYAINILLT